MNEPSSPTVAPVEYGEIGAGTAPTGRRRDLDLLGDVDMEVTVQLGAVRMPIRSLLALESGSVIELDRAAGAAVDILVNGRLLAKGDVVVIDEELGVRVTEIMAQP